MQQEINPSAENVRWVNAINRTPDHDGVVHLKIGQLNRVGNFFDNMLGKGVYIQGYEPWTLGEEKFDGIFWLDHSPNEQPVEQKLPNDVVEKILKVRDYIAIGEYDEAYHYLYHIADPKFVSFFPWKEFEEQVGHKKLNEVQLKENKHISQDAHEKEVMMRAFDKVRKIFELRSWIMEGLGSYPYNDDRYKKEVRYMYDEFDKLFKDTWANIKSHSSDYRQAIIAEYLKGEQKENEAVGWIDVNDRLPELETKVIVLRPNEYSKKNDVLMAYLHDSGKTGRSHGRLGESKWLYGFYWSLPAIVEFNTITHWMPLPETEQYQKQNKQ